MTTLPYGMLEGWGRFPRHETQLLDCPTPDDLAAATLSATGLIARGNGRSYGDAAVGDRVTLLCRGLGRMRSFDPQTGLLTVEAGAMLSDIIASFLPRGWFPPVVPGTKFVTVGGMIASDVHGKNHHRDGGFGDHLVSFRLLKADGESVTCSREENPELFHATIGGMGLTGVIAEATFPLKPIETGWILQETTVAPDLKAAIAALDRSGDATYSVAWIDCLARGAALGRSLVYAGEHATRDEVAALTAHAEPYPRPKQAKLGLPVDFPGWALNSMSVKAFNEAYFRAGARKAGAPHLGHWEPYFFPLDGIRDWNRLYGRRGFLQHQCVVPEARAEAVLGDILERFSRSGKGSFLAVLKKLRPASGMLSFPMPGYTLALDLPQTDAVRPLLDQIDRIVVEAGGRLYMAKDARQSRNVFEASNPRLNEFRELRRATGADGRFSSRLATRLGI